MGGLYGSPGEDTNLERANRRRYHHAMSEASWPPRPPGFEPPKDVNVPWYAWIVFPIVLLGIIGLLALILGKLLPFN